MRTALASLARRLESDVAPSKVFDLLGSVWARASAARVRRPLSIPDGVPAMGVGGATLGGSGKTPLAIALVRELAARGERVTFVGHAYRATPRGARFVHPNDDVRDVGDEAIVAARELAPLDVPVVVATTRQKAVDFATRRRGALVIDGLLQAAPRPLTRSLLAVDARSPWGNGRCPPAGDLRAPREALLAATDAVIPTGDGLGVRATLDRAIGPFEEVSLAELGSVPFGVVFTIARPERVLGSLARKGLEPSSVLDFGDHARPTPAELERAAAKKQCVKIWLATSKCATKLPPEIAGAPVLALDHRLELPKALVDWVLSNGPLPVVFCPSSPGQKAW